MKTELHLTVAVAVLAAASINTVSAATLYVSPDAPNPSPPYANWASVQGQRSALLGQKRFST